MRCLFVVPPFAGHVNPAVAVAAELTARGHTVAWCGPPEVRRLLPPDAVLHPTAEAPDGGFGALHARWQGLRGVAALRFLVEDVLVPLAYSMRVGVDDAIQAVRPHVVLSDQQAFAGAIGAELHGLPWATSATTSVEFSRPFEGFPKVHAWVRDRICAVAADAGLDDGWDPRFSRHLVLIFSTPVLAGTESEPPAHHRYVGPAFGARPAPVHFPWERLAADRRRVLVSLGTLNREAGTRFYPAVVAATRELADRVQVVLAAPEHLVGSGDEHVLAREFVPQLDLLPHLDAVVTHGGHNTVCEALAFGLPLVVAPIRDDQPLVAQQVVAVGAGVRVRFGRASVPEIRDAITAVLDQPDYRAGALRVRDSFAAAGGATAAANALEWLEAS
ncbi:glycosyltransferase [Yinghuangia soli]|uniref:Glycosyltransferase n=1 Tax=Yinghuangia soli TaxID=2908204 RepID=A0AA41U4M6_9ACTN|nr:nucleotide disphospho-sugar-binding domain-containing protein [Yinghuangia soli]MCF2530957.1 glycosyltransferase [Yinghuangia soli]